MNTEKNSGYRKNFSLIVTFIALISVLFVLSLFLAFNTSKKNVENEFVSGKVSVLERTIKPYNDFFQNKLPEISYYNGYLDSSSAAKFIDTIFQKYAFVEKVTFYNAEVKNTPVADGVIQDNFNFGPKGIYIYERQFKIDSIVSSGKMNDDFKDLAFKLASYVEQLDTAKVPSPDELFSVFSSVRSN
ncbi:MAG: sensor histidine kinase, partial [Sphingobacteriales bacterium]